LDDKLYSYNVHENSGKLALIANLRLHLDLARGDGVKSIVQRSVRGQESRKFAQSFNDFFHSPVSDHIVDHDEKAVEFAI
jgi:hypothetical protein